MIKEKEKLNEDYNDIILPGSTTSFAFMHTSSVTPPSANNVRPLSSSEGSRPTNGAQFTFQIISNKSDFTYSLGLHLFILFQKMH